MLGSRDYDEKMNTALGKASSRIKQGDEFVYCCHVLNQYPHESSNKFVNTFKESMHGVSIHAPSQQDVMKSASLLEKGVKTFVAPALGSGPIQPLELGDVYALISIAGTKDPGTASRPKSAAIIPINSDKLPVYENAPGYENPPAYKG